MHLKDHFRSHPFLLEPFENAYHRCLDDVSRTTLDGCIDGIALSIPPNGGIAGVDICQKSLAAEKCFHITLYFCVGDTFVHITLYTGEGDEILINQLFCLATRDVEAFRQSKGGNAVDNTEIGSLRLSAHISCHLIDRYFKYLGGCGSMDILPFVESLHHVAVTAEVGHDTQFDL